MVLLASGSAGGGVGAVDARNFEDVNLVHLLEFLGLVFLLDRRAFQDVSLVFLLIVRPVMGDALAHVVKLPPELLVRGQMALGGLDLPAVGAALRGVGSDRLTDRGLDGQTPMLQFLGTSPKLVHLRLSGGANLMLVREGTLFRVPRIAAELGYLIPNQAELLVYGLAFPHGSKPESC